VTTTLARTFAALSAINEAILYAKSPDELYQKVCDAGFSSGDFMAVAVFLVDSDGRLLRFAAGRGDDVARLSAIEITPEALHQQRFSERPALARVARGRV
jgi:hypothetical protein